MRAMTWERRPTVYIMASGRNGTLYVGVTSDVARRVWEHRNGAVPGFTLRYDCKRLLFVEFHAEMRAAIVREKQLKAGTRAGKVALIERDNPMWRDLHEEQL